jgi:hypothetical protein
MSFECRQLKSYDTDQVRVAVGWEHGSRPVNRFGTLELLNLLDKWLGLLHLECTRAQQGTQYRDCLKRYDAPDRFYRASFRIGPIGTSAALLSWRTFGSGRGALGCPDVHSVG